MTLRSHTREESSYAFLTEIPVNQALLSLESTDWMRAMACELDSVLKNRTWDLVPRIEAHDVIGSRFVLTRKGYLVSASDFHETSHMSRYYFSRVI